MGVIATLTAGFETVNRRLWLLLFPISLDSLLWCGPQVSIAPLVRQAAAWWLTSPMMSAYSPQQIAALRQGLVEFARSFNLLSLLSLMLPDRDVLFRLLTHVFTNILGVPVLAGHRNGAVAVAPIQLPAIELSDPGSLAVMTIGLGLAGLFLNALFLSLMAQIVRDNEVQVPALLRRVGLNAANIGAYLALGGVFLVVVGLPLLVLALASFLANPMIGVMLVLIPWLWLGFYLFLAPSAMLVSEASPLRAMWYSFNTVRVDLWRTLAFIGSVSVIQAGVSVLWQPLMAWPWGVVIGIMGNAYVSTGLVAATMILYNERYREWQEIVMAAGPR